MAVVHAVGFTPEVTCQVIVTANATLYSRHGSGIAGSFRLSISQGAAYTESDYTSMGARDPAAVIKRYIFDVTGGVAAVAALEVTRPGVGGYQFDDIEITVEVVKR